MLFTFWHRLFAFKHQTNQLKIICWFFTPSFPQICKFVSLQLLWFTLLAMDTFEIIVFKDPFEEKPQSTVTLAKVGLVTEFIYLIETWNPRIPFFFLWKRKTLTKVIHIERDLINIENTVSNIKKISSKPWFENKWRFWEFRNTFWWLKLSRGEKSTATKPTTKMWHLN